MTSDRELLETLGDMELLDHGPIVSLDEMFDARDKVRAALADLSGKPVDVGMGCGGADLWVTLDGVEYFVTMKAKRRVGSRH